MVHQLIGECLLRLQSYELLMKAIVARHKLAAPAADLQQARENRAAKTRQKTMGVLVAEVMDSFLVPDGQQGKLDDCADAPSIAVLYQIGLSEEDFARIKAKHQNLVQMRNSLVHHFLEQHDLQTEDGCREAERALGDAKEHIIAAYKQLQGWARDLQKAQAFLREQLESPELREALIHGHVPWPMARIAHALQDAAIALGGGDWVPLAAALEWVAANYPDEQPQAYGCTTWQQVVHECGRFDLQTRKVEGRRTRWYRPRPSQLE